jgi:hypothetical protein
MHRQLKDTLAIGRGGAGRLRRAGWLQGEQVCFMTVLVRFHLWTRISANSAFSSANQNHNEFDE